MERYNLPEDIDVFYITAKSFPQGIADAHKKLQALFASTTGRKFFGISFPDRKGVIAYKAAAQSEHPEEGSTFGCEHTSSEKENTRVHSFTIIRMIA